MLKIIRTPVGNTVVYVPDKHRVYFAPTPQPPRPLPDVVYPFTPCLKDFRRTKSNA